MINAIKIKMDCLLIFEFYNDKWTTKGLLFSFSRLSTYDYKFNLLIYNNFIFFCINFKRVYNQGFLCLSLRFLGLWYSFGASNVLITVKL
jgi:hypothetical protein